MYAEDSLVGGHVIMLGPNNDDAARDALESTPSFMQIGGKISLIELYCCLRIF